jgi:hypothetical protein
MAAAAVVVMPRTPLGAQQVPDSSFVPLVGPPAFPAGRGPRVALDEAHHNFHTLDGRYITFARLLGDDGFDVVPLRQAFSASSLEGVDVLVIADALSRKNVEEEDWWLPTPSAFTPEEIAAVRRWAEEGGALLLVADHMPFPGAASDLAAAFGFELLNGFVVLGGEIAVRAPLVFRRSDGSLAAHAVTSGGPGERIDSVATFTGEAFRVPVGAVSLLTLPAGAVSLNPDTSWVFHDATPRVEVEGWSQGAVMEVGRGRLAVFGEAAMFSAQLQTQDDGEILPMGMNAPVASENPRFLLHLMRWLARADSRR